MAKENKKFNKNLAFMIIVPVLVIVVTMSIMGVTFAWFTHADQTTVATINMSTAETFQITFDVLGEKEDNNQRYIYHGQEAFDNNGLLITDIHASEMGLDAINTNYILDKAFTAPFYVKFDTNSYDDGGDVLKRHEVDFTCSIQQVHVHKEGTITELRLTDAEDIKLGFTWYISDNSGQNEVWYTPYGTISSTQVASKDNSGPLVFDQRTDWNVPILNTGFSASSRNLDANNKTESPYVFYIVFAPEVLFWKQYGQNEAFGTTATGKTDVDEYNETAEDIYGRDVVTSDRWLTANSYSLEAYQGATYSFIVRLTVSNVTEVA